MRLNRAYLWLLLLIPLALVAVGGRYGKLRFQIFDEDNRALQWANVSVMIGQYRITGGQSDKHGSLVLRNIPEGEYKLRFFRLRFETIDSVFVKVNADRSQIMEVKMRKDRNVRIMH